MTDAKPDPLEELKAVDDVYVEACNSCMANRPLVAAAIAAWEKERADTAHDIAQWQRVVTLHNEAITAIRAAVEKVRDEAYKEAKLSANGSLFRWIADALDAALGGGA